MLQNNRSISNGEGVLVPYVMSAEQSYADGHGMANPHSLKRFCSLALNTIRDLISKDRLRDANNRALGVNISFSAIPTISND